jgi:protein O-GlcNAc transferase
MAEMTVEQFLLAALKHEQAGQLDQARNLYEQVLASQPDSPDLLYRIAILEYQLKMLPAAIPRLQAAIALDGKRPEFHYALGVMHRTADRPGDAIAPLLRALELKPDFAEACNDLGIALASQNQLPEAIAMFRQALTIRADFADALNNLGSALGTLGRQEEAGAAFRQAIAMRPNDAVAYNNLGHSLWSQGKYDEALTACMRAFFLNPNRADIHNNLGNIQKDLGLIPEALASYRKAIDLRPDSAAYRSTHIGTMNYGVVDLSAAAEEMRKWNDHHAAPLRAQIRPHENDRDPDRRLRIGYVSSDFCAHVSEYFLDPLLRNHDHKNFEIVCYAQVPDPDESTKRFQTYADLWHFVDKMNDDALADQIRQDKIDILVDLKLHTVGNRLLTFARKPAPVQVSWLGYPGTTGVDTIDWRLTDRFLEPPDGPPTVRAPGTERAARLPDCFWCFDPMAKDPPVGALPAKNAGHITFGSLNTFGKVNDTTLDLWLAALAAVPSSRLLVLSPAGSCRRRVTDKFRAKGVEATRVEFIDRLPRPKYLRTYNRIDIALDTFPCSGHTTSFDAMWMGVPVVTLVSPTVMGRATYTQLSNLNLQHLAAQTPEAFGKIAADLAGDLSRLAEMRAALRPRMQESPLMDGPRFARGVEAAFRDIWKDFCKSAG